MLRKVNCKEQLVGGREARVAMMNILLFRGGLRDTWNTFSIADEPLGLIHRMSPRV
uniref:Uncharacterized protein n=1 Tax=Anguilla anguilla TaxID=7936 RepID=A0A0E9WQQ0_ANGAN